MTPASIFFIIFSAFTIICSLMVVFTKNPIYSILYLILTMFGLSGHYLLLHAQFLSIINIIVYAGAIMVLFLFVLMLLNLSRDAEPNKSWDWKLMSIAIALIFSIVSFLIYRVKWNIHELIIANVSEDFGYAKPLGKMLFSEYVLPFELASILFIAAIVGIVYLGMNKINTKK